MIRHVSLRTRLALLYAGLAMIVLAISLLTVYEYAHRNALNRVDSSLRADADKLGGRAEGAEHGDEPGSGERFVNAREAVASGHLLALYDDHRVIAPNADARALATRARESGLFSQTSACGHTAASVGEVPGQRGADRQR